ncbi:hypothetical protein CsSME_00030872 [Camellia sinensis var. sinensis]
MQTLKDNPSWVLFLQEGPQRYRIWRISNTKRVATSMTHMAETIFLNPSKINPTRFEQQPLLTALWHSKEDQECVLGMSSPELKH